MDPKITAIIQARMTSTRLPGKVLKKVMGKPLLIYQIERLHYSQGINEVVIATTTNKEDDPIEELTQREGLKVYRGSEDDVLDRYYQTARKYGIDHIMRLTADCPLIDPAVCDLVIDKYLSSGVDFVHTGPTFAEGVDCEILSFTCLEKAWINASLKSEREHCTLYLHNHPDEFEKLTLNNETDDCKYRFTVDEPEDFQVVELIIKHFYNKQSTTFFSTKDVKAFLDLHPTVTEMNSHVIRNEGLVLSLKKDKQVS